MIRGLDHVVHVVRDLEAAGELYDMLGFTVGARNRHPWGTQNRIVQTPGFFLELLEIAEPEQIPPHGETAFSFGAFNRDFLAEKGPGLPFLVLEGRDPAAEKAEFDAAGFGGLDLFDFARTAKRPDGSDVEVAFSLAFARDPASPHTGFFTCTQRRPENFWAPDLQRHMNGTTGVAGVVLAAEDPAQHLDFLSVFTGASFRRAVDGWHIAETPRGRVEVLSGKLFSDRFDVAAPSGPGLRLAAVRFAVEDIDRTRRRLGSSRMTAEEIEGVIVVGPKAALGAMLVFEPAA
ncbi:catechol 2,3-dioxygenase-like lactoylglutathione lyase family enzyme [Ancylobacter sp. 3268]|uniref:VOC family protein n=1 Tax=Ancylobacter sp. 3268 TaxID=2817752 RepID=UPI002857D756|nr:VOC family protein [Ancylobacter sp. 3268]MDR6953650.1 catechol 2,3-dioxygenase-like lactoylglutathione lyase family enzyme [Ancylobacter sp. 3268]